MLVGELISGARAPPASLKHLPAHCNARRMAGSPGRARPGLIEACPVSKSRRCRAQISGARAPRPH